MPENKGIVRNIRKENKRYKWVRSCCPECGKLTGAWERIELISKIEERLLNALENKKVLELVKESREEIARIKGNRP